MFTTNPLPLPDDSRFTQRALPGAPEHPSQDADIEHAPACNINLGPCAVYDGTTRCVGRIPRHDHLSQSRPIREPLTVGARWVWFAPVIRSFKNRNTRRFFEGHRVAAFHGFADQAVRRLTLLAIAESLGDLAALPGNRLESLRGDRAGQWSIRINAQWRICFRWEEDGPCDVEIVDYHA